MEKAYRSRLHPCGTCAASLAEALGNHLGRIPSGERARLALPTLQAFHYSEYTGTRPPPLRRPRRGKMSKRKAQTSSAKRSRPADTASSSGTYTQYGNPTDVNDIRFSHVSEFGWGTASYGQHPEEHLGTPTDDDHDWRGSSAHYE
ncbi:hypothetical protein ACFWCF_20700 [Rhodococcus sp. NPDC060090]|uniref:hypothetical protein n=1 Tax=Rhodococcus sp. NPDC060090 TaxID=3347056 RepID=UPI00365E956C